MRSISVLALVLVGVTGCSGSEDSSVDSGGSDGTGGAQAASGGSSASGSNAGGSNTGGSTLGAGGQSTGGASAGGSPASGGAESGGSSTGGSVSSCGEQDAQVCNNGTGTHCGYTYEYWKDQGSGCLTNTSDGFSVEWNNINNLLGRKGLRPGSKDQIVTYDANYQPDGNSYLCVYGWTRGPLVEYYIVDSWGSWRPPGEGLMGTVESDGGTYDIYRTQRVNQPSIDGNATFDQYWSVRTQKRERGTITVANHFNAWAGLGMSLGSLYEVSMCVEGYQSSGTADVTMSMQ